MTVTVPYPATVDRSLSLARLSEAEVFRWAKPHDRRREFAESKIVLQAGARPVIGARTGPVDYYRKPCGTP